LQPYEQKMLSKMSIIAHEFFNSQKKPFCVSKNFSTNNTQTTQTQSLTSSTPIVGPIDPSYCSEEVTNSGVIISNSSNNDNKSNNNVHSNVSSTTTTTTSSSTTSSSTTLNLNNNNNNNVIEESTTTTTTTTSSSSSSSSSSSNPRKRSLVSESNPNSPMDISETSTPPCSPVAAFRQTDSRMQNLMSVFSQFRQSSTNTSTLTPEAFEMYMFGHPGDACVCGTNSSTSVNCFCHRNWELFQKGSKQSELDAMGNQNVSVVLRHHQPTEEPKDNSNSRGESSEWC